MKKTCSVFGTVILVIGLLASLIIAIATSNAGLSPVSAFAVFLSIIVPCVILSVLFFAMSEVLHLVNTIALSTYDINEALTRIANNKNDPNLPE